MSNASNPARKKCGCGKTKDPQGFCDGSHAKVPAKTDRKKCGCGKTKDPGGFCDGSHAK
jgi:CDGSH-type Zn-finger protein